MNNRPGRIPFAFFYLRIRKFFCVVIHGFMNSIKINKIALLVILLCISAVFFAMIRYFLTTIFLAAIFSALAMPLFKRFELWLKGRKNLSAVTTILTLLLIVFFPMAGLFIVVSAQAIRISHIAIPWIQQQISSPDVLGKQLRQLPYYGEVELYREEILQKAAEFAGKTGTMFFNALSSFTFSAINDLFLIFVFLYTMFFFLKDGRQFLQIILSYLPMTEKDQHRLLDKFISVTRATLKGCLVLGLLQGSLAGLALHFAGIGSAVFWGAIMSIMLAFPILGPPLVWVFIWIPCIVFLAATGQYPNAVALLIFLTIVVHPIDNILRPVLVGRDTQMHELLVFFGTLGGLSLFGVFGIFIGPIVAALFMTVWEIYGETFREYLYEIKGSGRN